MIWWRVIQESSLQAHIGISCGRWLIPSRTKCSSPPRKSGVLCCLQDICSVITCSAIMEQRRTHCGFNLKNFNHNSHKKNLHKQRIATKRWKLIGKRSPNLCRKIIKKSIHYNFSPTQDKSKSILLHFSSSTVSSYNIAQDNNTKTFKTASALLNDQQGYWHTS